MSKKLTKLERSIKNAQKHRRHKRQPYGMPLKRLAKSLAYVAVIVAKRKYKD